MISDARRGLEKESRRTNIFHVALEAEGFIFAVDTPDSGVQGLLNAPRISPVRFMLNGKSRLDWMNRSQVYFKDLVCSLFGRNKRHIVYALSGLLIFHMHHKERRAY
jgi:hypothetical protein